MKRNLWLMAAVAAAVLLFSCQVNVNTGNGDPNNPTGGGTAPDFNNHYTDNSYSILVRNGTNQRLVAFKDELSPNAIIGGVPANANNHGLPKDPALFNTSKPITMIMITETQYNASKDNLNTLQYVPFEVVEFIIFLKKYQDFCLKIAQKA